MQSSKVPVQIEGGSGRVPLEKKNRAPMRIGSDEIVQLGIGDLRNLDAVRFGELPELLKARTLAGDEEPSAGDPLA
jgi:hypothetical protein